MEIKQIKKELKTRNKSKNEKSVLEFTQIMEQLISSGLSVKDSLEVCSSITSKKENNRLAVILLESIKKGNSFADAINEQSMIFSSVYRGIIKVGDKTGSVEKIFPRLRNYLESQKKIKDKISSALLYPCIVLVTTIIVFLALIFFVFPKLKSMFAEFGGNAAILLENNINKMQTGLVFASIVFCILIILPLLLKGVAKKNKDLELIFHKFQLKIPILGKYIKYKETLNFAFAMETLTASGISIEAAIEESMTVISNKAYRNALVEVNQKIVKGEALSDAFNNKEIFPPYMTKWMIVGERSGNTEGIFSQIKDYFQNEIDLFTSKFMTLIEPALIVLIGIFLVILILLIIVPVFSMYGEIL